MSTRSKKKETRSAAADKKTALEEQLETQAAQEVQEEVQKPFILPPEKPEPEAGEEEELRDRLLRLQADFDNFRKRTQRERAELFSRATEELVEELLPVMDHFEMGLETAEKHQTDPAVTDGFKMVYDQMRKALEKFNLTAVEALGLTFDPHTQEAVSHLPSAEHPENTVMAQVRRGWLLGGKLLRPAQVVVSSGQPGTEQE